jgi:hypothetical protein
MSNIHITYLVGALSLLIGLAAFGSLVVVPALTSYRRAWERMIVLVLSGYVLAALAGIGVLLGALVVYEWPKYF